MIFRTHHKGLVYVIKAQAGSTVVQDSRGDRELVLFQVMPGGLTVERRLPASVVVLAAERGSMGLAILERRRPWSHPEVETIANVGNVVWWNAPRG
jgi:hypothetical protein